MGRRRRRIAFGARIVSVLSVLQGIAGYLVSWPLQETTGAVSLADNIAVTIPDTRNVATLTYAAYVAGANWANSSAQIARHTAGSVATIQQNNIIEAGSTWEYPIVISNRTAGSVSVTGGDIPASINGTTVVAITAIGDDVIITPTTDFDGDIDLAQGTVRQTDILASSAYPGAEALSEAGDGVMDADNYTPVSAAALTDFVEEGQRVLKVARAGTNDPRARQAITTIGLDYNFVSEARSDGNAVPRLVLQGLLIWTGVNTHTNWQEIDVPQYTGTGVNVDYQAVTSTGTEYCEFRLSSVKQANPLNGDGTGTTPGVAGGGNIQYMWGFDGATSFDNIYSAELNSIFDPTKGTLIVAARVANAGVWTDGSERKMVYLYADADNYIFLHKDNSNNAIQSWYRAGGVTEDHIVTTTTTGLFVFAMTWDKAANQMLTYLNGVLEGTDNVAGVWVGNLSTTKSVIGAASTTPGSVWNGDLAYPTLYNEALTQPEIAAIVASMGV